MYVILDVLQPSRPTSFRPDRLIRVKGDATLLATATAAFNIVLIEYRVRSLIYDQAVFKEKVNSGDTILIYFYDLGRQSNRRI